MEDAERERHERRQARDRRRREQGKPAYFESDATLDSWPVAQDPSERPTMIVRPGRDRGELVELEAQALDQEGQAAQVGALPPAAPAEEQPPAAETETGRGLARSGVIFAIATGLSRVIGLVREIAQAAIFGIAGPVNAFEIAFLIPNTVRSLVADSALSAAFVPVFSDLLVKGERKRAWRVASSLFWLMLLGLGGLTALFVVVAPLVMALFGYGPHDEFGALAAGLARILFPLVLILGLTGIVVGILNSYDHFTVPALSPVLWNLIILLGLGLGVQTTSSHSERLYIYAVAILVATIAQFLLPLPWLRGLDGRLQMVIDIHDPAVKRTFVLMVPVTIGLGLINLNAVIDQLFATHYLNPHLAPAAIVRAFRLYMLPQGVFSVAVATVLFPLLSRHASRQDWRAFQNTVGTGLRLISFLLVPASVTAAVLATPIVRLLYQHQNFTARDTPIVAACLAAFALGLTFNGTMLMLNRGFFSLQSPWIPSWVAFGNLGLNAVLDAVFYRFGIWGIPLSTSLVNIAGTGALLVLFRRQMAGFELGETVSSFVRVVVASLALAAVGWGIWYLLDSGLGRSLPAQVVSLGAGLVLGYAAFFGACRLLNVRELDTLLRLRRARA
ncbi:MAG TPA: murein biosynthesis integral membrane protein MurJ [Gaiellaceae bacterium]|nr:murein biosynthesis integral membrane protein MurJ [Gaiellaceae bacterium]